MTFNRTVLLEKFEEGDSKMYDYLIDNAESDKDIKQLLTLQALCEVIPNNDPSYLEIRNSSLFYMGVDI